MDYARTRQRKEGSMRIDYSCPDPSREIGCTQLLSYVIVHNR